MFWKKKEEKQRFQAWYKSGSFTLTDVHTFVDSMGVHHRLATESEVGRIHIKLDLILDHLKLKYVPETETKEPAKLVEKTGDMVGDSILSLYYPWGGSSPIKNPTKPKKKGRPKKK